MVRICKTLRSRSTIVPNIVKPEEEENTNAQTKSEKQIIGLEFRKWEKFFFLLVGLNGWLCIWHLLVRVHIGTLKWLHFLLSLPPARKSSSPLGKKL